MINLRAITTITVLSATALLSTTGIASAATSSRAGSIVTAATAVRVPMHVEKFDAKIAASHGYLISKNSQGQTTAIAQSATKRGAQPNNVVGGNCGESYLWITPDSTPLVGQVGTGFSVDAPTIDWGWTADFHDPYGTSAKHWSGTDSSGEVNLAFAYEEGGHGQVQGQVTPESYATLADGSICVSGEPSDSQYL